MLVQYNLANTCSCFISRVFWIEETDNKCNKGGICWLGLPVGDNQGEMCIYTGMLDGLTIMLENDLKAVLAFTRSNTPNGKQPKLWQLARQFLLLPVETAECSLWILHDNFCPSLRQYFLIFSTPDAARKKIKHIWKWDILASFAIWFLWKISTFKIHLLCLLCCFFHEIFTGVGDPFALWFAIAMIDGICPIAVV